MSIKLTLGDKYIDQFSIWDNDGISKISGITTFDINVWYNGTVSTEIASVVEIGATGEYKVEFTPTLVGYWKIEVVIESTGDVWVERIDVETSSSSSSSSTTTVTTTTIRQRNLARIAILEGRIVKLNEALDDIIEGKNIEYMFSEPDGAQRAKTINPESIMKMISYYESLLERLYKRINRRGLRAIRIVR